MRINDLARDLEVKSKQILEALAILGIEGKHSHSSSLEEEHVRQVRRHFGKPEEGPKPEAEPARSAGPASPGASVAPTLPPTPAKLPPAAPRPEPKSVEPVAAAHPVSVEPVPTPRASAAARMAGARVLRPPIRAAAPPPAAAPAETKPATPPAPPAPIVAAPAPPQAPVVAEVAPPTEAAPPAVAEPPAAEPPPVTTGQVGSASRVFGNRPSLISGVPAAGSVPPGTIIRAPGAVPGLGTGARPSVGKPIYQPRPRPGMPPARPGAPARPPYRPGAPSRPGAPMGAAAGSAVPGRPYERRPMHPTRARPSIGGPGAVPPGALPPGPAPGRLRQRPAAVIQDRDRERGRRLSAPVREVASAPSPREITRAIAITEGITVKDLAEKLKEKTKDLMQVLIKKGVLASINQPLESALATDVARYFGAEASVVTFEEQTMTAVTESEVEDPSKLVKRSPVVTIMGHVDHGKTSLLDAIRETAVAASEAGGITQHIGAYQVVTNGRKIAFIDTPGHEAFTRMRARGAKVTDIVVLVVAADDGVMPQTMEAIDHARAAKVPIIVAINKVDKPEAMPDRVKKQLGDRANLMPEDWGGETVMVEVSAKLHKNLDLLLEMILLVADIQDLKANPDRPANGVVLEAQLDRGRGPVATVLVQNGTLRVGDPFIVGPVFSKVRALMDDRGKAVESAGPATPVQVLGLASVPQAGDQFQVITDIIKAKQIALYREQKQREQTLASSSRVTLEQLHAHLKAGLIRELPIILKTDVQGSAEVLADALSKIPSDKVKVKIIHTGVGAITESDVLLATASNAIIIGFNVRPERKAQDVADQEKVDIRLHTIIYQVTDEVKKALTGLLEPTTKEVQLGRAEVRQTFRISKVGSVAGCYVLDGLIKRHAEARLVRDSVVIHTGRIGTLRRFKDDASEVKAGFECGVTLDNFADVKPGDVIEAYVTERVQAALIQ